MLGKDQRGSKGSGSKKVLSFLLILSVSWLKNTMSCFSRKNLIGIRSQESNGWWLGNVILVTSTILQLLEEEKLEFYD